MKYILLITLIAFCTASCNDWLDVRPETEQKEEDQFSSVNGFFDALTGCYMTMAGSDLYGERLMYTNIESLASPRPRAFLSIISIEVQSLCSSPGGRVIEEEGALPYDESELSSKTASAEG